MQYGPILHDGKNSELPVSRRAFEIDPLLGTGAYRHTCDPCGKGEGFFRDELFQYTGPRFLLSGDRGGMGFECVVRCCDGCYLWGDVLVYEGKNRREMML